MIFLINPYVFSHAGGGGGGPYVPPTFLALNLTPGGYTAPSVSSVSLNLAN